MIKCLECGKKRRKLLVHNTNRFFCMTDCKRLYCYKLKNKILRLETKLKELKKHKKKIYGK